MNPLGGGSKGGTRDVRHRFGPIYLIIMQFLGKTAEILGGAPPFQGWRLPSAKSWINHGDCIQLRLLQQNKNLHGHSVVDPGVGQGRGE